MSAQTGLMFPPAPRSTRFIDRARFRLNLLWSQPNPLWIRELRQAARLRRTPLFLMALSMLMTLLIAAIGGMVATKSSPATTGVVIFQVFFSLAYFVVTLVGPAVAANSIASEREGHTWEAVLLTGLSPGMIARGKFLAAFTSIAMYIVMLAPVGALPFLFGGVTATEVVVAFVLLFLIAVLAIAFGLAISSKMSSLRTAIVLTLLLAIPISVFSFVTMGFGLSYAVHGVWPGVAEGPPIWLPTAYLRAPFSVRYVLFLVVLPLLCVVLPAWFLYEVTIANLTSITDDRSSGIKRWFLCAVLWLTTVAMVPIDAVSATKRADVALLGLAGLGVFFSFFVFWLAAEPIGPSRRITMHWDRKRRGQLRRFLGPGVMRSAHLLLMAGVFSLGLVALFGVVQTATGSRLYRTDSTRVVCFAGYAMAFLVFMVGLAAFLRTRASSTLVTRVLLLAILFVVSVGPWVVAAIAGLVTEHLDRKVLFVAAPSPMYVFVMLDSIGETTETPILVTGIICAMGWAVVGLGLLTLAERRCTQIIRKYEAMLVATEQMLTADDAAAVASRAITEAAHHAPMDEVANVAVPTIDVRPPPG